MNTEEFTELTLKPNEMTKEQLSSLELVLEAFPYFQAAQVIHLKGLKEQRNFKYNNTLKKVAAYTTNRTVLFDFITANVLDYQSVSKNEEAILKEIEVVDSKVIEHLYESITVSKESEPKTNVAKDNEEFLPDNIEPKEEKKRKEKELEIGTPINFNKRDMFSFNEWLQLTPSKPIKREKKQVEETKIPVVKEKEELSEVSQKIDLIEQFIQNKPKIKPVKSSDNKDISVESTTENTSLMTETLARVYLEQKKYNEAISAFKILSLKYPEKSSFFADRIEAIKFLQKYKS